MSTCIDISINLCVLEGPLIVYSSPASLLQDVHQYLCESHLIILDDLES